MQTTLQNDQTLISYLTKYLVVSDRISQTVVQQKSAEQ